MRNVRRSPRDHQQRSGRIGEDAYGERTTEMAHAVVHWEIGARDAAKLEAFYRDLFGWDIDASMPEYHLVAAAGEGIGGGIMQTQSGVPPYVTFYVTVDDLDAHLAKAGSLGARTIVPPTPIPNVGAFAMILDPEEHVIGLMKMSQQT
jgi:hypothetical protein